LLHRSNKINGICLVLGIGMKFSLNLVYFSVKLCQNILSDLGIDRRWVYIVYFTVSENGIQQKNVIKKFIVILFFQRCLQIENNRV